MKKEMNKIIKIIVFIVIASFPFITVTQSIGLDTFLDSFENPDKYIYIKQGGNNIQTTFNQNQYFLIQKTSHPDFNVQESDIILYCEAEGGINYNKIHHINRIGAIKRYHVYNEEQKYDENPIYSSQILGKVVKIIDNNIWNELSMKIWEISINNLNPHKILSY